MHTHLLSFISELSAHCLHCPSLQSVTAKYLSCIVGLVCAALRCRQRSHRVCPCPTAAWLRHGCPDSNGEQQPYALIITCYRDHHMLPRPSHAAVLAVHFTAAPPQSCILCAAHVKDRATPCYYVLHEACKRYQSLLMRLQCSTTSH